MGNIPQLSVITVTLNAAHSLASCLQSVAVQKDVEVDHIVVDGGSKDETLDILLAYNSKCLNWVSELDGGISDAMNKGAKLAKGQWLMFLQADDRLLHERALSDLVTMIPSKADILIGGIQLPQGPKLYAPAGKVIQGWPWITPFKMPFCHQGILISSKAWARIGTYNCSYKITMDYDWVLRAYWQRLKVIRAGIPIAEFGTKGLSSTREMSLKMARLREENRARIQNAPNGAWRLLYQLIWNLYYPYKRLGG